MIATVSLADDTGMDVFYYEASTDEVNEDTGERVWDDMSESDIIAEMQDRAAEQARILFPKHEILGVSVEL